MTTDYEIEQRNLTREVDAEAARLIREGIAELAGKGYGHFRIAMTIRPRRTPGGIRQAVNAMADKLPNPDSLPPLTLVQLDTEV